MFDENDVVQAEEGVDAEDAFTFTVILAKFLGYMVAMGSLILYTPIAVRVIRQNHADGLVISTWWLKLSSYVLSDIYYVRRGYNISTYAETVVITIESLVILILVAHHHKLLYRPPFISGSIVFVVLAIWGFTVAPMNVTSVGQLSAVFVNTAALFPQFYHNYSTNSKGDYSPLTASLASVGCLVRLFTTVTLNNSDPVLLFTFVAAFIVNFSMLCQILYYGVVVEQLSLSQVFMSDVVSTPSRVSAKGGPYGTVAQEELEGVSNGDTSCCDDNEHNEQCELKQRSAMEMTELSQTTTTAVEDDDENDNKNNLGMAL